MVNSELLMKVSIQDDASKYFEQLSKATGISTKELETMGKTVVEKSKKIDEALKNIDFEKLGISSEKARKIIEEASKKQEETVRKSLEAQSKALEEASKKQEETVKKSLEAQNKALEEAGKKQEEHMKRLRGTAKKLLDDTTKLMGRMSVAVAGTGILSTKSFIDFEMAVKQVQTISEDSFENISDNVRKMAIETGTSAKELTNATYEIVSAIGDVEEKYLVLATANKLSVGGFTTTTKSVDVLTTILNAYKLEISDVEKVSDLLIQTQNKGKVTVDQLASSLGNVIPTAAAVGVNFETLSTAMALLTSNGINAAESSTALNAMFTELSKGSTEASKAFKKATGMGFVEYMKAGGDLGDALALLKEQADKTGDSLLDLFNIRSFKGAQSIIDTLPRFKEFQETMKNSAGSTEKAFSKMMEAVGKQLEILYAKLAEVGLKIGEALIPRVIELVDKLNDVDFEKVFSQENIDKMIATGEAILAIYLALKAISTLTAAVKLFGDLGMAIQFLTVNMSKLVTILGASGGGIAALFAGIAYGVYDLNKMNTKNIQDLANIKKENSELEKQKELLNTIKSELERGVADAGLLSQIDGFDKLREVLAQAGNEAEGTKRHAELLQEALRILNSELDNLGNKKVKITIEQENQDLERLAFGKMNADIEEEFQRNKKEAERKATELRKAQLAAEELQKEIEKIMNEYEKTLANAPKLADGLGLDELDQVKAKLSTIEKAYTDLINNGADGMAKKLIPEMQKLRKETEELSREDKLRNLFKDYREDLEKLPTISEIMGLDEEAQLEQKITKLRNLLVGLYNADGTITDKATFEKHKEELEVLLKEREAAKKLAEMKKKEENAMKDLVSVMNNFGSNLIAIGQGLNSTFLENTGNVVNAFSSITDGFNLFSKNGGLKSITGMFKGGMADSVMGLETITGALTSVSGMVAGFNVAKNVISSLDGGKAREQIEKNNEANKEAFKESTQVLLTFVEAIKSNISAINSYSNTLLGYATNNTTLAGIEKVQKNFDNYINAMVEAGADFGDVTGLVKSKAKYKSWFKSKSEDSYTATGISEADILKAMGITNTNIKNMDESQLNDLVERLKVTGIGDIGTLRGENFVDSNFEEWKEGIYEYVGQINKLREEQEQLFKNSTLNAFEGIDVSSYKSLIQEYTQMFEDMGLNADAYKDTIEEMARNAQVLVTAMQDVRSSFVEALSSGEASDFSSSMSSYFKKILNNAAQVTYDVAYSSIDEYMTKEFEKISEKLVDMKKSGVLDFDGFWDDFNFNKILEADRITTDYEKVINDLRSQLESRGLSTSLIDSMLPATELSERINDMKNMLSSAMSEALDNNSFASFEESLGNSIYESVKDSLIQAFVDSEVYKTYMNQFYNMDDIKEKLSQATSAQQGFGLMQDYLKDLEYELEKMGLSRGNAASGNSTEDNTLGNSYYQDSGIEYNITIEQHFSGVYGFDAMYDVARNGAIDAIEEWENKSKVKPTI